MRFLTTYLILPLLLALTSCSSPCRDYCIMGADEFVCDSYRIRQGKQAILEMQGVEVDELHPSALEEYRDTIVEDDILNIVVFHPTRRDLMESFQYINQNVGGFRVYRGEIDTPFIPPVYVQGLTLDEAREKIQEEYRSQIHDVEIFVTYKDRLARKVELAGLVGAGNIPVDGRIRLFDVIARSHISPQANLFMSYVLRQGRPLSVDLHRLMNQGDMTQNIVMKGGDKIFIANPSDANVMIMGEVRAPRAVNLPYGFMSLREALVQAGGIPFTGDRRRIQVIRGNLICPKIYVLAWEHIVNLPNDSLLVMPGDTVYITEKPITQWNRFIDQLLPSCIGFQNCYGIYSLIRN